MFELGFWSCSLLHNSECWRASVVTLTEAQPKNVRSHPGLFSAGNQTHCESAGGNGIASGLSLVLQMRSWRNLFPNNGECGKFPKNWLYSCENRSGSCENGYCFTRVCGNSNTVRYKRLELEFLSNFLKVGVELEKMLSPIKKCCAVESLAKTMIRDPACEAQVWHLFDPGM